MGRILIFGGTTEGRELARFCGEHEIPADVCVTTLYGAELLPESPSLRIFTGVLDEPAIEERLIASEALLVIDATHPYAVHATENIRTAAEARGIPRIRCLREESDLPEGGGIIPVRDTEGAVSFLSGTAGRIFLTTGSHELPAFADSPDLRSRLIVRVLPTVWSIQSCVDSGIPERAILAMCGPFSTALNEALMREYDIRWLVTKESGKTGGFPEKLAAAKALGIRTIVIRRPPETDGMTLAETEKAVLARKEDL